MKILLSFLLTLIFVCSFGCAQPENKTAKLTVSNANLSTPAQVTKEEQLLNLLSGEIIDSIGGEKEKPENIAATKI